MAAVDVQITGLHELERATAAADKELRRRARKAVDEIGIFLTGQVQRTLNEHASQGKVYRRGNITHYASKGGYPPNSDTGLLATSIRYVATKNDSDKLIEVSVGSELEYAIFLEYGTSNNLEPRPFLEPALTENEPAIQLIMRSNINA